MLGHAHSRCARVGRALATALVLWFGGAAATALAARAAPPPLAATVEADITGETARLTITPSTKVDYSLHTDAEGLVLELGVPVDIDMHPALLRLRPFIDRAEVADDGRRIALHFATALTARSWYHRTSIVIALTPAPPAKKAAATAQPATTAPATTAPAPTDQRAAAAKPEAEASASLDEEALHEIARRKAIEAAQAAEARRRGTVRPAGETPDGLPSVAVEGESGADYSRLVFAWPGDVAYTVRREPGDEAVVAFMQPANLDIDAVSRALPRNVLALRAHLQGGVSVVWMKLAKGATLRDAREGSRVVLYIEQKGATAAAAPAAPTTGPRVRLTSREGDGHTRLVFDWPKRTSYRFRVDGDQAVITFAKPGRIDLDKLARKLPRNIAALQAETGANGGLAVRITLAPGATIADKRQGRKVALTIADPPAAKAANAAAPEGETPAAPANPEFLPPDQSDALFAAAALPPDFAPLELPAVPVEMASGSAQRADAAAGDAAEPPYPAVADDPALPVPAPKPAVLAQTDSAAAPDAAAEGAPAPDAAPSPETASAPAEPAASVAAAAQQQAAAPAIPAEPADLTPVRIKVDGPAAILRVALPKSRTAAAFQRAGQTWVVFDWPVHLELSLVRLAHHPAIGTVRQLPSPDASVLLFTGTTAAPRLSREGEDWVIGLRDQAAKPNLSIPLQPSPDASALVLDVEHPGATVRLADPEVGDSLLVTPVETPGLGVADAVNWPAFRLLPTIQGIAVAPLGDSVQVVSAPQGVTVAAGSGLPARGPSGAEEPAPPQAAVPAEAVAAAAPGPPAPPRGGA
ncbi:MAG: hypothetical protein IRY94_16510, partial [Rhodospirillaceae bacterium]|nr:hypothetical protein [Rhodospirillaceae bacterium]